MTFALGSPLALSEASILASCGGNRLDRLDHLLVGRVPALPGVADKPPVVPVLVHRADELGVVADHDVVPHVVAVDAGAAHRRVVRVGHDELGVRVHGLHVGHDRGGVRGVGGRHFRHAGGDALRDHRADLVVVRLEAGNVVVGLPAAVVLVADLVAGDGLARRGRRPLDQVRGPGGLAGAEVDRHHALRADRPRLRGERGELERVPSRRGAGGAVVRRVDQRRAIADVGVVLPVVLVGGRAAAVVDLGDVGRLELRTQGGKARRIGPRGDVDAERSRGESDPGDHVRFSGGRAGRADPRRSRQNREPDANARAHRLLPTPPRQSSSTHRYPAIRGFKSQYRLKRSNLPRIGNARIAAKTLQRVHGFTVRGRNAEIAAKR